MIYANAAIIPGIRRCQPSEPAPRVICDSQAVYDGIRPALRENDAESSIAVTVYNRISYGRGIIGICTGYCYSFIYYYKCATNAGLYLWSAGVSTSVYDNRITVLGGFDRFLDYGIIARYCNDSGLFYYGRDGTVGIHCDRISQAVNRIVIGAYPLDSVAGIHSCCQCYNGEFIEGSAVRLDGTVRADNVYG